MTYWSGVTTRTIIFILLVIASFFLLKFLLPLTYPFIIGWLISMMIEPIVSFTQRRLKMPRWLSTIICLLVIISIFFSLFALLIAEVITELSAFAKTLPTLVKKGENLFVEVFTQDNNNTKRLIDAVQKYFSDNPNSQKQILNTIQENIGFIANKGTWYISKIIQTVGTILGNLPLVLTTFAFIILSAFSISWDWPNLRKRAAQITPHSFKGAINIVIEDIKKAVAGFFKAQLILISITFIIILIGLLILSVPYALTISLVMAVVDLIPYVGVGVTMLPWMCYVFFTGDTHLGFGLLTIYCVLIIFRQIMEPKLVAINVGIHPLATLVSIFVGLKLLGIIGVLVGPIVAVIIVALHRANVFKDIYNFIINGPRLN